MAGLAGPPLFKDPPSCAPAIQCTPLLTLICPGIVEEVEDGDQDVQHVAALQHKEEEFLGEGGGDRQAGSEGGPAPPSLPPPGSVGDIGHCAHPWPGRPLPAGALQPAHLVEVAELPEEDQQLLVELDLLGGVGQVGLEQGVGQQPGCALEDELEVLGGRAGARLVRSLQRPLPPPEPGPTREPEGPRFQRRQWLSWGSPSGSRIPPFRQEGSFTEHLLPAGLGWAVFSPNPHKARE